MNSFLLRISKHSLHCALGEKLPKQFFFLVKRCFADVTERKLSYAFGQPTPVTHPHLLSTGELLPGLKLQEFKDRRYKLMSLILDDVVKTQGKVSNVIVVIPSASKTYMTEKIPYVFRQKTDFLYLSGCLEPDTALILSGNDSENFTSTLFVREPDPHAELWDGPRTSPEDAIQFFGVDLSLKMSDLPGFLKNESDKRGDILLFYDNQTANYFPVHNILLKNFEKISVSAIKNPMCFLHQLRAIKSSAEQELMKKAGEISSLSIIKAIQETQPGMCEHQLFAIVDYESRMKGAETLAYVPVVASGNNANIIHYINNNQVLKCGELVLMDAGCEFHGYAGDISRTWPVNGKFNKYQRILYEIVLDVQMELISLCKERCPLNSIYKTMIHSLLVHLRNENIIKHDVTDQNELLKMVCELSPHHSSHYLGMDIHDVESMPKNIPLQSGMIITVEPGLYVRNDRRIASEFWNTGIRIEDDILITDSNYEVLSALCPKTIDDIEDLMLK